MNALGTYAITVFMVSFAFICYLLNQIHLDLKEIESRSGKEMIRSGKLKDRQGYIFSLIIIIAAIIFSILIAIETRKGLSL